MLSTIAPSFSELIKGQRFVCIARSLIENQCQNKTGAFMFAHLQRQLRHIFALSRQLWNFSLWKNVIIIIISQKFITSLMRLGCSILQCPIPTFRPFPDSSKPSKATQSNRYRSVLLRLAFCFCSAVRLELRKLNIKPRCGWTFGLFVCYCAYRPVPCQVPASGACIPNSFYKNNDLRSWPVVKISYTYTDLNFTHLATSRP